MERERELVHSSVYEIVGADGQDEREMNAETSRMIIGMMKEFQGNWIGNVDQSRPLDSHLRYPSAFCRPHPHTGLASFSAHYSVRKPNRQTLKHFIL